LILPSKNGKSGRGRSKEDCNFGFLNNETWASLTGYGPLNHSKGLLSLKEPLNAFSVFPGAFSVLQKSNNHAKPFLIAGNASEMKKRNYLLNGVLPNEK